MLNPVLYLSTLFISAILASAAEPWSDPRLTQTNHLTLWIDVSRQNAARGALGLTPLQSWSDAPDILLDASGRKLNLHQPLLASRPRFRQEFNGAMLSFDGTNDFLSRTSTDTNSGVWTEATIFLVAAPRTNGGFRGVFALNRPGRNDYTSGLNLDFGSLPLPVLARVNAEGAGFTGEANLLQIPKPLGTWHVFTLVLKPGPDGVKLFLDGQPQSSRLRTENSSIHTGEITLGARRYSNTADRPHAQGFFMGDFTELLAFDHALSDSARSEVERYLTEKYGALLRGLEHATVREGAVPLIAITNPPPIQMHFPGFEVRPLAAKIGNVNNVRYRPDGKLVAMGYDGRIWLLSDTDSDGLEDKAALFWDKESIRAPIGIALTPPNYPRGQGVFVAGKGKVVLILDKNADDLADEELSIATWKEPSEQHGVDSLGVAVGPDGSIYFSLGAASFTEPYLIDRSTGQAHYRLGMQRGTIQRVSPDFKTQETVCTGIRFAVGLAFNHLGDLFCTDQEGATWVPNGNPFDELLHIQPGKHYGFPPRHPRHLPSVIDEPNVFDFRPQHQSTCGLQFNRQGTAFFGPKHWADDALVAGYSRGKIWRTKLVKTDLGYVAQAQLLATMQSLTVDTCVSPRGDLIVASHSGQPDWGSGPKGEGYLWSIRPVKNFAAIPQPLLAWNASPTELSVTFDQPLAPESLRDIAKARLESGQFVFPGDRYETIRPGYQVVYDQLAAPRYAHEILSTQLSPDRKTITFVTRPRHAAVNYAATLPDPSRTEHAFIDINSDLTGVEAEFKSASGESSNLWLQHLDTQVTRALTAESETHEKFLSQLTQPGTLTIRGQLDLSLMLQPSIQLGSTIDWTYPPEQVTVVFSAAIPFEARFNDASPQKSTASGDRHELKQTFPAPGKSWQRFELRTATGAGARFDLTAAWFTVDDSRLRPFPVRRILLPWAHPAESPPAIAKRQVPEIAGGQWHRGRELYFSAKLACSVCHKIRGEGGEVGPDLSNLTHRDFASVRKDIQFPNAALNPDHVASHLELADGESATGLIKSEKDEVIQLALANGATQSIRRSDVKSIRPASLSLMPEKLWEGLSAEEQRDLMTFLLKEPLKAETPFPEAQGQKLPPARKRAEVQKLLESIEPTGLSRPLKIVLCASPKDPGHGAPGFHDYPLWRERWSVLLGLAEKVQVETADRWPSAQQWATADLVAFYHDNPAWDATKASDLDSFLARGGGLVFIHWSLNAYRDVAPLSERLGAAWGPGAKFRYGKESLHLNSHEITRGLKVTELTDESYWKLTGKYDDCEILATTPEEDAPQPQIWTRTAGKGRVFVCIPGHFTWTFDDPIYRLILLRGMAWAAREPVNRFAQLSTVGARFED